MRSFWSPALNCWPCRMGKNSIKSQYLEWKVRSHPIVPHFEKYLCEMNNFLFIIAYFVWQWKKVGAEGLSRGISWIHKPLIFMGSLWRRVPYSRWMSEKNRGFSEVKGWEDDFQPLWNLEHNKRIESHGEGINMADPTWFTVIHPRLRH